MITKMISRIVSIIIFAITVFSTVLTTLTPKEYAQIPIIIKSHAFHLAIIALYILSVYLIYKLLDTITIFALTIIFLYTMVSLASCNNQNIHEFLSIAYGNNKYRLYEPIIMIFKSIFYQNQAMFFSSVLASLNNISCIIILRILAKFIF